MFLENASDVRPLLSCASSASLGDAGETCPRKRDLDAGRTIALAVYQIPRTQMPVGLLLWSVDGSGIVSWTVVP